MILELHATPKEVMRAVETLQAYGREQQMSEKDLFGLALALEECGSNIVNHALHHDPRQTFQVSIEHNGNSITVELRDHGPEFDPTRAHINSMAGSEENRPPGGWGIQITRHFIDNFIYRRENGQNILRLTRKIDSSQTKNS
jgi:anti-sigma regulatory factor (Ser/Thr protein kinase)